MTIIGLTGTNGAGKNTVAEYLMNKWNFELYSVRSILIEELEKIGWPTDRDHMKSFANSIRAQHHAAYFIELLYNKAKDSQKDAAIESIRTIGELGFLRQFPDFYLIAVDADPRIRYERSVTRGSSTDKITFEQFLLQEKAESQSTNPAEINITAVIKKADFVISNDGSLEEFHQQIDNAIKQIKR